VRIVSSAADSASMIAISASCGERMVSVIVAPFVWLGSVY
jgi:hypothetical protein